MANISALKEKSLCCGCGACKNACPTKCITMEFDDEGFRYPIVNKEDCVNCGKCVSVCPYTHETRERETIVQVFAAQAKEKIVVENCSSGGVFAELAKAFIRKNGIVYGATYISELHEVGHIRVEKEEDLKKIYKSKYLQSSVNDCYKQAELDLTRGKMVLFSGTPCQIAGLYGFLGNRQFERLVTVDVVCHGVPSQTIFEEYLGEIEKEKNAKVIDYKWRSKTQGWKPNTIEIMLSNGKIIREESQKNKFQKGFLHNLYLRPSCYSCPFPTLPRVADISLGDFWGYDKSSKFGENKGISMVVLSSEQGKVAFEAILDSLKIELVDIEYAKRKSIHLWNPPIFNKQRRDFFEDFYDGKSFSNILFYKYLSRSSMLKNNIKNKIKKLIDFTRIFG